MSLSIRQNLLPSSKYTLKSPYVMTPTRLIVHNTANDASANNEISYMVTNNLEVSFHYAVDDIEAVQGLPENRNGWHAGDGRTGIGNRQGIGIEICYSKSGGDRFIKAERNACILIAQLLKKYGWGIDKVTKHQDYSGKYCPHRTLDMGWQRFLNMVQAELNGNTDWKSEAVVLPEDKRKYITNKKTALYKIDSGEVVKEFEKDLEVGVDYQYKDWYLTGYSFDRDIKNGFKVSDLDLKKAEEEPIEQPLPEPEPTECEKRVKELELEVGELRSDLGDSEKAVKSLEKDLKEQRDINEENGKELEDLQKNLDNISIEKNRIDNERRKAIEMYNELRNGRFMWVVLFLEKLFPKK